MTDDTETRAAPATRLAARRVLVTGGTSGLGLAMAGDWLRHRESPKGR